MGLALRVAAALAALGGGLLANADSGGAQSCARPNVPAMVVRAVNADIPLMAQQQGISGNVQVMVSLDASSHVIGTRIMSSPSAILNNAALTAARESTYQTEVRDCVPIASYFIFTVQFVTDVNGSTPGGRPVAVINALGSASRPPDIAYLTAAITTTDSAAAASAAKNSAVYDVVRARLKPLGVDDAALRTTSFGVLSAARPADGFVTTRQIAVTVSDVSKAVAAFDALVAAGVTNVGYVRFELLDRHAAYGEALAAALKDANDQAQAAARASHMRVAGIERIVVGQNLLGQPTPAPGPAMLPAASGAYAVSIHPAPVEVHASVTVTYLFKP